MRMMTLPTFITSLRLFAVPIIMFCMLRDQGQWTWLTEGLFIFAAGTDWLDGYLARRLNQVSELGKFLDPLVDKLLVFGPLLIFVQLQMIPAWVVFIILARDLIISGWRVNQVAVSGANFWGKAKTITQLVAIGCIMSPPRFIDAWPAESFLSFSSQLGWVLFWISVALTVFSGVIYLWPSMTGASRGQSMED